MTHRLSRILLPLQRSVHLYLVRWVNHHQGGEQKHAAASRSLLIDHVRWGLFGSCGSFFLPEIR